MKLNSFASATLFACLLPLAAPLLAAEKPSGHGAAEKKAESPADAALIAKARAGYPLKTCLVSDEPLGSMGEAVGYIHRAAGQPDRVVFVCCAGCIDDFKASPSKFLQKVDAAKAKSPQSKKA